MIQRIPFMHRLSNQKVATKMFFLISIFLVCFFSLVMISISGMSHISIIRAIVGGESLYVKNLKNAVSSLRRYSYTHDEADYHDFVAFLKIPEGFGIARSELNKSHPDVEVLSNGLRQGGIHSDETKAIAALFIRFRFFKSVAQTLALWAEGDSLVNTVRDLGESLHAAVKDQPVSEDIQRFIDTPLVREIETIDLKATDLGTSFSKSFGDISRKVVHFLKIILILTAVLIGSVGLIFIFVVGNDLIRGIKEITDTISKVSEGNFDVCIETIRGDEIGRLAQAFNYMTTFLKYSRHEVQKRTGNIIRALQEVESQKIEIEQKKNDALDLTKKLEREMKDHLRAEEERILLERQLAQAQKLESIGTLAAGIAHEINTPIQFIGDNSRFMEENIKSLLSMIEQYRDLLKRCDKGDKTEEAIRKAEKMETAVDLAFLAEEMPKAISQMQEGVKRVALIVSAMKDFSHAGSAEKQPESINEAIETTLIISRSEWKYVADMKLDLDGSLPKVNCFIGEIKQVILNLIVNAAYTIKEALSVRREVKGCIEIKTYQEGRNAVISVRDTGMGIPENVRDKVFDHFFTTKEVGQGSGQGLSIAYQSIVEKHGGKIWFETEVGQGTTFFIMLPLIDV